MDLYYYCVFGLMAWWLGCCVGSFMNVCIWRIPRKESIVWPPSHCPKCNAAIKWYQNLPIISWLALRGKCANCHEPISPRYIGVEVLGGVLFLAAYLQWAAPGWWGTVPIFDIWMLPVCALVFMGLILGSFIDLAEFWLPDRVTIGGMILGVPLSYCVCELQGVPGHFKTEALLWSVGGLAFGFFFLWAIGWVFSKLFHKEALGFGDVKLLGAVGAFFGPLAVLFVLIVSSVVGAVVGVGLIVRGRTKLGRFTAVPFGPFIAFAVLVWMFWGPTLVASYLRLFTVS